MARLPEEEHCIAVVRNITFRKIEELKLAEQLNELNRWHSNTLGREGRIIELKREINAMASEMGQSLPYPSVVKSVEHD